MKSKRFPNDFSKNLGDLLNRMLRQDESEVRDVAAHHEGFEDLCKMLDDLKGIKDVKILAIYGFNFIEVAMNMVLKAILFQHHRAQPYINSFLHTSPFPYLLPKDAADWRKFEEHQKDRLREEMAKRCSDLADDIIRRWSVDKKSDYCARILEWDKETKQRTREIRELRNIIAHGYHCARKRYHERYHKEKFQYVKFGRLSVTKNICFVVEKLLSR